LTREETHILTTLAEIAGNAIHRMRLHAQTVSQLEQLTALRAIDVAISSSHDLTFTLNVLLDHLVKQLRVDAADILLLDPQLQILEFSAGVGFRRHDIRGSRVKVGQGLSGHALQEQALVHLSDDPELGESPGLLFAGEEFVTYYGMPLAARNRTMGVLEIFHRSRLEPDQGWIDYLEAFAGQAAIAIDNAELFESLEQSNTELAQAYDATIEGWSRALDLRDKETEGHTQRVTEKTLLLARAMGFPEEELIHVRRGALLHDIGKMGVPDAILSKPDELTVEEWVTMRRHTTFAYDMLSPIQFLKPALDIPYCHHEKWDGSGYPRGLKGEEIPLMARIFAVVDVWDALTSDRVYRPAWSREAAFEYICQQRGKHFDPMVVDEFVRLLGYG
jgi:putative nucleotidyltransferase with HDIG domain